MFLIFVPVLLILYAIKILSKQSKKSLENKHVVITGGSSGIGKCFATLCAKQGADVTIIARTQGKLDEALEEIEEARMRETQKIRAVSLDVTKSEDVKKHLSELDEASPIYMLANCAGMAVCGKIEDTTPENVRKMIDINFYGTYFPIKYVITKMKKRKEGIVVITGSQASLMGIFGYSAYSASKFALRGLAEALHMEVKPYDISVTLALPPDTDTPGFERENESKPEETRLISESGGIFKPETVASKIMSDALAGNFFSHVGLESFLLTTLCTGMTPFTSTFEVVLQSLLLGPFKLICSFYLRSFHRIVERCATKDHEKSE